MSVRTYVLVNGRQLLAHTKHKTNGKRTCAYVMKMRWMEEERERRPPRARLIALATRMYTIAIKTAMMTTTRMMVMKMARMESMHSVQDSPVKAQPGLQTPQRRFE